MRITRITITNFRTIESVDIAVPSAGVLVLGRNAAGKSTFLDAATLLYGRNRHTSRDGKCATPLARTGAKEWEVAIEVEAGEMGSIIATPAEKSSKVEMTYMIPGGELVEREAFFAWAGVDLRTAELSATLPAALARSDKDSFGAYLSEYLAGTVTLDVVLEHAGGHGEWLVKECDSFNSSAEQWRKFGKACYTKRTELKGQIKTLETAVADRDYLAYPMSAKGKPLTLNQTGAVEAAITAITDKIAGYNRELGAALVVTPEPVDTEALEKEIGALMSEALAITAKANAYNEAVVDGAALKSALDQADIALRGKMQERSDLMGLGKTKTCRTCRQKISGAHVEEMVAATDGAMAGLEEAVANAQAALKKHQAAIAEHHRAYNRDREKEVAARLAVLAVKVETKTPATTNGRTPETIQGDIDAAAIKLADAQKALSTLREIEQREADRASVEYLTTTWEHLDWAVKSFHEGALLNLLVAGDKRMQLLAAVNDELGAFGHVLDITPDGKLMRVTAARVGAPMQPYEDLSEGQQWICQFAICLALAGDGAPVILDGINHLDGKAKQTALARLRKCKGTVILAGAWSQSADPDLAAMSKAFRPALVVWMDKGAAIIAESAEVAV